MRVGVLPRVLLLAWLCPVLFASSGLINYNGVPAAYLLMVCASPLVGWILSRAVEVKAESIDLATSLPDLRRLFVVFFLIATLGNVLMVRAYSNIGLSSADESIQSLYVEIVSQENGALSTGALGSIAQVLRIAMPFAVIFGVMLLMAEKRVVVRALVVVAVLLLLVHGYRASFSRNQMLFYSACAFVTFFLSYRGSWVRLLLFMLPIALAGTLFYIEGASERAEILGVGADQQQDALMLLFDISPSAGSDFLVKMGGVQCLGLVMYLAHPVIEGARLLANDQSPMLMGALSFFPFVNPLLRVAGIPINLEMTGLSRPNMWYSAVGELYIDFGFFSLVVFPLLVMLMTVMARRRLGNGVWGRVHYIVTCVFFLLFPLYSVFQSYGLIFAASLMFSAFRVKPARRGEARRDMI